MTCIRSSPYANRRVDFFQAVRIFEGSNRIRKIHAVLAKVLSGFAIVPFILHTGESTGYR